MTEQPGGPAPEPGEAIDQPSIEALEDAEDLAAIRDWEAREAAGTTKYYPMTEFRRRLGLEH